MSKIGKLFILVLLVFTPLTSLAWNDCPYNETNCTSPGLCSDYIDTDNDGICDHSQPAPADRNTTDTDSKTAPENIENTTEDTNESELISGKDLKTKTVGEIAGIYQINADELSNKLATFLKVKVTTKDSFQFLHDKYDLEPNVAKNIATEIKASVSTDIPEANPKINNTNTERTYHALPITLSLIVLYFISFILSKLKIISLIAHKKIWNVFLLIAFLVSGFSGMLLIIRLNSNFVIPWPFNLLFWHVETGIAMFIISLFHIIERRTYFKNMFLKKK